MEFAPKLMGHKFCAALLLLTLASAELRLPRSSLTGRGSYRGFKKDGRFPSMKGMVWIGLNLGCAHSKRLMALWFLLFASGDLVICKHV